VPARLINIKYITIRAEKVASPVTALQNEGLIQKDLRLKSGYTILSTNVQLIMKH